MFFSFAPNSITRRVITLAWPSVMEQSLITLIGLVDTYIVGHLGAAALAGVGLGGQVLNLTAALFGAVGVGATALIARHIGAQEPEEANRLSHQALLLALSIGAVAAWATFVFAEPIIRALGAEPEVVREGALWLRVVSPTFAAIGVLLAGTASLRGAGDTRSSLVVMVAVNLVNVAVAWTLTRGLGWGVLGTALGAATGQMAGAGLVLILLWRGRGPLRLPRALPRPDVARVRRLLNIGLPAGAEQVFLQLAQLSLALILAQLGTAAYAAHQIGIRISALAFLPGWGFGVAATTLVGQELGAGRPDRARQATYVSFWLALVIMSTLGAGLYFFAEPILKLFTTDADVIRLGVIPIQFDGILEPLIAAAFVFGGGLRGAGDTRVTLLITAGSIWGLRLITAYVLAIPFGLGLLGVWLAIGVDFVSRAVWFWLRFRGGKWVSLHV